MTTLRKLVEMGHPPYASVIVSAPSRFEDAEHRMEIRWKNARRALDDAGFPEPDLEALDEIFADTKHDAAEALAVVRSAGGPQLVEHLADEVREDVATVDELPRLGPILASRQRAVPHVVVTADRAGADIVASRVVRSWPPTRSKASGCTSIAVIPVDGHSAASSSAPRTGGKPTARRWRTRSRIGRAGWALR